jgi:hypothetical protein
LTDAYRTMVMAVSQHALRGTRHPRPRRPPRYRCNRIVRNCNAIETCALQESVQMKHRTILRPERRRACINHATMNEMRRENIGRGPWIATELIARLPPWSTR